MKAFRFFPSLIIVALLLTSVQSGFSQTSWKGTTSTTWSTSTNWTNGVPTSTVSAIIGDANFTGSFQPSITSTANCLNLTIGGVKASTLTLSTTSTFTVSGNLVINSNGTLSGGSGRVSLKGNWTNNGTYTISSSRIYFAGTAQTLTGSANPGNFYRIYVNAGSTLTLAQNLNVSNRLQVTGTLDPTETPYLINGTGALTLNSGGILKVTGSLFADNYGLSGTKTINAGSTINYCSSVRNQTVSNAFTYSTLLITGTTIKTLAGSLPGLRNTASTYGNITVSAGTLDLSTYTADRLSGGTAGGTFSVANGATLRIGSQNYFPLNYATYSLSPTSTVEYYYNGTQTVASKTYGHLLLTSSSGAGNVKTMPASTLTIAGNLTSSVTGGAALSYTAGAAINIAGKLVIGSGTTFNGSSFSHTVTGNIENAGTLTGSTSTITMNGPGTSISGAGTSNFNNLTLTGSGITAAASTSLTVAGNLTTSGSGTFTHTDGSGVLTMSGTSKSITGSSFSFSNLTVSGTITSTSSFPITGNLSVGGSFTSNDPAIITLTGSSKSISGAGTIVFFSLIAETGSSITTSASFSLYSLFEVKGTFTASAGTATFKGTSTISGSPNLYNADINGTSLTLSSACTLGIAGTFSKTAGSFIVSNVPNTVNYNGGAQNILATTYYNLRLTNGNTKSATAGITVNKDLSIETSTTFSAGSYTHSLAGNWSNTGTFTAGTSTVELTGSTDVTITGATTFSTLTLNKSSQSNAVNLASNISTGTLTMTTGTMNTGSNAVTITGNRSGNGIILGTITHSHSFTGSTAYAFEGPYNLITFDGGSSVTAVTLTVTIGPVSGFPDGACVNRKYVISGISGSYTSANLQLHYEDSELNGNDETALTLWRNDSPWASIGQDARDNTNNYITKNSISNTNFAGTYALNGITSSVSWNGSQSTAWETKENWTANTGSQRVPTSSDVVRIGDLTFTNQPTIGSTTTVKSIEFYSTTASTLTLGSGATSTTLGNIAGTWSGSATHTISVGDQTLNVQGDLDLSDGTTGHRINITIGAGTVNVTGSVNQTADANITFSGAGTLKVGGSYTKSGSGSLTAGSGTVECNGTGEQHLAGVTYYHMVINKNSGIAYFDGTAAVGGNLTVTKGTLTLSQNVSVTGNVNVESNGTLLTSGSYNTNVGGNWTVSGTFTPSNGSVTFNGTGAQSIGTSGFNDVVINKSTGTATLTGNITPNGNMTISAGTLELQTYTVVRTSAGGTFAMSSGTHMKVGGTNTTTPNFSVFAINAGSTIEYYGSIAQYVSPVTYGNLLLSNTSATLTLAGNASVMGNLTINSGVTFDASSHSINLAGNWSNSGTFTPSTSTVILSGSGKTITGATTFNVVNVTGSYTVSGSNLNFNGALTIGSGATLAAGSGTSVLYGDMTNNGTVTTSGTITFAGTALQTIALNGTFSSTAAGVINFNGTVSPVLNSAAAPAFMNVNINNTGGVTPSLGWTVYGAFTVGSGASFNGNVFTHTFYNAVTNSGTVSSSGILRFTPTTSVTLALPGTSFTSTGEVVFGGTGAITLTGTLSGLNDVTVTNSNAAGITPPTGWTIAGTLTVGSTSIFNAGSYSYSVAVINSSGTLNGGTSTFTMTSATSEVTVTPLTVFNHLVINGGATLTTNTDFTVRGNFTNNGTFDATNSTGVLIISGTGSSTVGGSTNPSTIADLQIDKTGGGTATLAQNISSVASLNISNGTLDQSTYTITQNAGTLTIASGATLKLGGTNGVPTFTTYALDANSTVEFAGTTQSVTVLASPGYGNLKISTAGGSKTAAGALLIRGNFDLSTGTFVGGSYSHSLGGNWTMSSGTFTNTGTTVVLNGSGAQAVSSTGAFNNLTLNKTTGATTLATDVTVNGTLTFTTGKITTGANKVIISSTGSVSRTSGHVVGNFQKYCATGATSKTFEIGDDTYYSPVTVAFANISVAGNLVATCTAIEHPNLATSGIDLNKSVSRYWTLTNGGITFTNYGATFTFVPTDIDPGANTSNFIVKKYTAPDWTSTTTGTRTSTSTQATGMTSFCDFAIGEAALSSNWTGGANTTVWSTSGNWSSGVPNSSTNITIPGSLSYYPNLSTGTGSCQNITINSGASVTVSGGTLQVAGTISNSGTLTASSGTVEFNSTAAQTLTASSFASSSVPNLTVSNSHSVALSGALTVNGTLALTLGEFSLGANTLTLNGDISQSAGTLLGGSSSNLTVGGSGAGTGLPAVELNNLTLNRANGITLTGDVGVAGALTLTSGTLATGAHTLTLTGSSLTRTSGNLDVSNASGTVVFANASALSLPASVFTGSVNNISVTGAGGITAGGDLTVNGTVNLPSANPSAVKGLLDMGSYTLTMGSAATNTGSGDVTGIVKRTSFTANVSYTYGNEFTDMTLSAGGTMPTDLSIKISIGSAPSWKTTAVQRTYDIVRTGAATGTLATFALHYLPSEMQANTEGRLIIWDYHNSTTKKVEEHGKSNQSITEHWIAISNRSVGYFGENFGDHPWGIADKVSADFTWQGTPSSDWNDPNNWSGGIIPTDTSSVVIPDAAGTGYDPALPATATVKTIEIQSGGILDGGTGTTLTIAGNSGAWRNQGTFNTGTSTVAFSGTGATISGSTDFYNLTISNSNSILTLQENNIIRIAGTLTNNGTLRAASEPNTVEYNGAAQTVINPNGYTGGYYNLILSGSGTAVMPGTSLRIVGDLQVSGTVTTTAASALTVGGGLIVGSDASLSLGSYNHTLSGNLTNYGSLTGGSGYSLTFGGTLAQAIGGTGTTSLTDMTVNNTAGVSVTADALATVTGTLTVNSGKLLSVDSAARLTVSGTMANNAGTAGFVVKSGGSLIQSTAGVSATVKRYIAAWGEGYVGYHFLSSPMAAQAISSGFTTDPSNEYDFFAWWEATNEWVNYKNTTVAPTWATGNVLGGVTGNDNFIPGKGYLVEYKNAETKQFSGTLNYQNVSVSNLAISAGYNRGWHLLGNPFPCALTWGTGDWSLTHINGVAKIWKEEWGSYVGISSGTGTIPALNGMMVQVTEGYSGDNSLTIPAAARTHDVGTPWYKVSQGPEVVLLARQLEGATVQESIIQFRTDATNAFDPPYDSYYLPGYAPTFCSVSQGQQLSTIALPESGGHVEIPFDFVKNGGSSFAIEAQSITSIAGPVILKDLLTGTSQDLTVDPVYTFTSADGDITQRFLVVFSQVGIEEPRPEPGVSVWSAGNSIFIIRSDGSDKPGDFTVYNMVGQPVMQGQAAGGKTEISLDAPDGYYLVRVVTEREAVTVKVWLH